MTRRLATALAALSIIWSSSVIADQALGTGYRASGGAVYFRGSPSNFVLGLATACPANQWAMGSSPTTSQPICVQPTFGNVGGTLAASQLPVSGVVAGSYGGASQTLVATVDQYGRVTSLSTQTIAVTLSQVTNAGTAAAASTGTGGATLCLLSANCTSSGANVDTGSRDMSGATLVKVPTAAVATNDTTAASTAHVQAKIAAGNFAPLNSPALTGTPTTTDTPTSDSSGRIVNTRSLLAQIASTLSSNSVLGFRNRLINGDDRIDQRNGGAAQTITAGAALAYTDDRFYAYSTGANVTGQRVAGGTNATASQFRYQFTGAASVTGITRCQRISAANSYDMAGQSATFGVDLADSLLTSVAWSVSYANSADSFGTVASPTTTAISSGSFTVNATLVRYSTTVAIPAAATTGLQVCLSVGAQTSGTLLVGAEQLEMGSTATVFERRPLAFELSLAMERYEVLTQTIVATVSPSGQNSYATWLFKVRKASSPTIAYGGNGTLNVASTDGALYQSGSSTATQINAGSSASSEL